jgi:hypothetical protein
MAYIRKVKTGSDATAVQIVKKVGGEVTVVEHLGSAHTELQLKKLLRRAREILAGKQKKLFDITKYDE